MISKGSTSSSRYQAGPDLNQFHSKSGTPSAVAAGRFSRIGEPNTEVRIFKTVEQHVVTSEPNSTDENRDPPYYGTKKGSTTVKIDEAGSDIELIPWPEVEAEGKL